MAAKSVKELIVYQKTYRPAMLIYEATKKFPPEKRYALTSQIRRSSRSVCLNLREAWAKRKYHAHFISRLNECDGENSETDSALDFARDCQYISTEQHAEYSLLSQETGRMLGSMINNPQPFIIP
ncbi:MAG: four helix bundle protein [Desulfonatronovibrio sp. MSAO_Bac4]|nr:MAG: four helix bundle protein [Desulfonatronovibrio sp. MSAO_Bac4]